MANVDREKTQRAPQLALPRQVEDRHDAAQEAAEYGSLEGKSRPAQSSESGQQLDVTGPHPTEGERRDQQPRTQRPTLEPGQPRVQAAHCQADRQRHARDTEGQYVGDAAVADVRVDGPRGGDGEGNGQGELHFSNPLSEGYQGRSRACGSAPERISRRRSGNYRSALRRSWRRS